MGDYVPRVIDALLASALLPVRFRMKIMRYLGFKMAEGSCVWSGASFRSNRVMMGSDVFINVGFFYDGCDTLRIGKNVRIGQFVRAITGTHNIGPSHQRCLVEAICKPVEIQDGCWIGTGAIILPGVTIARGCVIAAGAIVTKSTEPNGLYAGNPARFVRMLAD
ncbi:MAG: acyltransferase [Acidiphilium sp.]|nr:acyltransferase [Acidiphilium sp.]MDD4936628.1 acyltransferase [Acidiphilium sp.]